MRFANHAAAGAGLAAGACQHFVVGQVHSVEEASEGVKPLLAAFAAACVAML